MCAKRGGLVGDVPLVHPAAEAGGSLDAQPRLDLLPDSPVPPGPPSRHALFALELVEAQLELSQCCS